MESLQRYDLCGYTYEEKCNDGEWVKWEQHQRMVEALQYQIYRLESLLKERSDEP